MSEPLDVLVDRVHKALVHDAYETNDITSLLNIVLRQKDTIGELAADNQRLTEALGIAGQHIEKLEGKLDSIEPMTHLVQYAEGSN